MADSKLSDLPATTSPAPTDILYIVTDPAGTPADKKVTVEGLRGASTPKLLGVSRPTNGVTSVGDDAAFVAFSTPWTLAVTLTVASDVVLDALIVSAIGGNNNKQFAVYRDGSLIGGTGAVFQNVVNNGETCSMTVIDEAVPAGSYTYEIKGQCPTSRTITLYNAAPSPEVYTTGRSVLRAVGYPT